MPSHTIGAMMDRCRQTSLRHRDLRATLREPLYAIDLWRAFADEHEGWRKPHDAKTSRSTGRPRLNFRP